MPSQVMSPDLLSSHRSAYRLILCVLLAVLLLLKEGVEADEQDAAREVHNQICVSPLPIFARAWFALRRVLSTLAISLGAQRGKMHCRIHPPQ